jgi:hypothetical protein
MFVEDTLHGYPVKNTCFIGEEPAQGITGQPYSLKK